MYVLVVNHDGVVKSYNQKVKENLCSEVEISGKHVWELFLPTESVKRVFYESLTDVGSKIHLAQCYDHQNTLRDVVWSCNDLLSESGEGYIIIIAADLLSIERVSRTAIDHQKATAQLKDQTEQLLIDQMRNALAVIHGIVQIRKSKFSKGEVIALEHAIDEISHAGDQSIANLERFYDKLEK